MAIQEATTIPEVQDTIVMLRHLSADQQVRQEAYYREKLLHDEASALGNARREGIAEGRAEGRAEGKAEGEVIGLAKGEEKKEAEIITKMYKKGKSPEEISDDLEISIEKVLTVINNNAK